MSEASPVSTNYAQFYTRQSGPLGELRGLTLAIPALLLLVLAGILTWLGSPLPVWGYIAVLWTVSWWGFQRLRKALAVTSAAVLHLEQTATYLASQPTRDDLLAFLRDKSSPDDLSNVPEALLSLSAGQVSGESIRVAANTSFAHPTSELNFAAYVRNAMVLGGLFGTVLFFAIELGGTGFQEGNVGELLPGLRGALASTLTGILGSLSLGFMASRIEHHLAQLVWETEAFASGPVAAALTTTPPKRSLHTEVDLWEALREEVARLADRAGEVYDRLGADIHGHARSLEVLSQQLGDLPAVQVPPELGRLGTAIDQFTHGTDVLAKTSTVLVEAVGALGVFAPARLLDDVERLASGSEERDRTLGAGLVSLADRVKAMAGRVDEIHGRVGVPDRLWESLAALDAATRRNSEQIAALAAEVRSRQDAGAVTAAVQHAVASVQGLESGLATLRADISSEVDRLGHASSGLDAAAAGIRGAAAELSGITGTVAKAAPELQKQAARLADTVDRAQRQEKVLLQVEAKLRPLDEVYAWHERARRAPLMRLLTLPLLPAGGLRALFGRRDTPPVRIVRRDGGAAPAVAAERQPAPAPAPSASLHVVPELYRRWCLDQHAPRLPDGMEASVLRFDGTERADETSVPSPVLRDHAKTGEFVRFSLREAENGLALPNPQAFFNGEVHRILFPGLDAATYNDPQQLAAVHPVFIRRRADGAWERA